MLCELLGDLLVAGRVAGDVGQVRAGDLAPVHRSRGPELSHSIEGSDELVPEAALGAQDATSRRSEAIEAPAPLARALDPPTLDEATLFQPVEHRVKGGDLKPDRARRLHVDLPADVVAMAGRVLEEGEDEQLRGPLLHLVGEQVRRHIYQLYICQ